MNDYIYRYSKFPFQSDKRDFYYKNKKHLPISKLDPKTQKYIDDLKIPPGYHPVKISLNSKSKILAIGEDKIGKKQYIYNPSWINRREKDKYCKLKDFASQLPLIKSKIQDSLRSPGMNKDKMIALVLRIIFMCHFRVGNDIGTDVYNSYGITTITKKQVVMKDNKSATIKFVGKSGVTNECILKDKQVVELLHRLYSTQKNSAPLFSYKTDGNVRVRLNAKDVNNYLKTFGDFTSKYFRTWVANITFIDEIMNQFASMKGINDISLTARKKIFRDCIQSTAKQLYHTPAICKKSYVSKELWTMFIEAPEKFERTVVRHYKPTKILDASENAFIHFLDEIC